MDICWRLHLTVLNWWLCSNVYSNFHCLDNEMANIDRYRNSLSALSNMMPIYCASLKVLLFLCNHILSSDLTSTGSIFRDSNYNLSLWEASFGSSYMCRKEQSYNITDKLTVNTFELQVQPFAVQKNMFGTGMYLCVFVISKEWSWANYLIRGNYTAYI